MLNQNSQAVRFSTENLPFLFQYEYFNIAWGLEHEGFYLLPDGSKYSYNAAKNENVSSSEFRFDKIPRQDSTNERGADTDVFITPDDLFHNLSISTFESITNIEQNPKEILRMIKAAQKSEYFHGFRAVTDRGVISQSALYFNTKSGHYERVLLATEEIINLSKYTQELCNIFGLNINARVLGISNRPYNYHKLPSKGLGISRIIKKLKKLFNKTH
jgi:hypothetical protein